MVKVSVIIPVYNVEDYLTECLDSIINQTFSDIEIICVNDGSTDNSLSILESYKKSDNRIKVFSQENAGQGAARNKGVENSCGVYVCFVDADDYIPHDAIEKYCKNIEKNNSDVVISKLARFEETTNRTDYSRPAFDFKKYFKDADFDNFTFSYCDIKAEVMNTSFSPCIKFYKRDFLINNNITFPPKLSFEDVPFHILVMLYAEKLSFIDEFLYFYRFNQNSTMNTSENGFDIFRIIEIVEDFLKDNGFFNEFIEEFKYFKIKQLVNYILTTNSEEYFKKARKEITGIDITSNNLLDPYLKNRYELILNSSSLIEYELAIKSDDLKKHIDLLSVENEKLTRENKSLKSRIDRLKKSNQSLLNSKSWKITKPLRKFSSYSKTKKNTPSKDEVPNLKDIKVALIADQFTYDCYKYEFNVITINPDNWKEKFDSEKPDLFFCESAWEGHNFKGDAPWLGKIYNSYTNPNETRHPLLDILEYCKSNSIPTVFWNKEDPPHYRNKRRSFADTANEFDYIFTSSKECVKHYKNDYNHPHVNALLFAGQPKMFNPMKLSDESIEEVVFAGSYYQNHPERTRMMDDIFDRLIKNNIDLLIYDRQYYKDGNDFPERFSKYIHPPIEYSEIPDVYRKMKWGLNFNIVTQSETMFARRIYELALSNVNIISNYSLAVEKIFGANVFVFDRRDDLPDFNKSYENQRMNNLYNVLENHTYTNRWKQILDTMGFEYVEDEKDITVIFKLNKTEEIKNTIDKFNQIDYKDKVLKIIVENEDIESISEKYPEIDSIHAKINDLKIDTEYWIVVEDDIEPEFIKKAILHYQYLDNNISITKGREKFTLNVENNAENKVIHKSNFNIINQSDIKLEVYYI